MSKTFDQGKDEVAKICRFFATNLHGFRAAGVKEAHIRQQLIDPLFVSLGWDVRNEAMIAPQYREVVPEDSLEIEGQQKAPDYTFRVGSQPKFFVEAKKCGININLDPAPAFQIRRYGFSAKVALSILTDFEELGVYDCGPRPKLGEKASFSRIQYFKAEEYPDRFREIWDIFSKEAVWSGAFDQYAASKRKRGTSEVDSEFLKEIEGWRDILARNIALRNPGLSLDDLNAAVQLTIDRIVFLRMAEDRGIEPYEQLLKLCERTGIYAHFVRVLCRKADEKYNSGLFHFEREAGLAEAPDRITPCLNVDDKVIKPILQSLYFEFGSPYQFGVMPVEILGTVYERFLGKVIRLTDGHQAKIEEKPEVRKAGGVYYTPAYIVNYIVKNTVGKKIEGKSPAQLAGGKIEPPFRVLDMACGSGSFLLGAYQLLLDHCLTWYQDHKPETHKKAVYKDSRKGEWRLSIEEKKRILIAHIFGVDIDPQAVEVSKLSLLLKVLEGETDQTFDDQMKLFQTRALPNLSDNIKCGNSLIGPDYFSGKLIPDPEELKRVNPFDWNQGFPEAMKAGGFDCVIGNPPYIRIQTMMEWAPLEVDIFKEQYKTANSGNYDIHVVFVEKGLGILNQHGRLGFILPTKFFTTDYGESLRKIITDRKALAEIVDFGHDQVFDGATTYTCLLFLSRIPNNSFSYAKASPSPMLLTNQPNKRTIKIGSFSEQPWTFGTINEINLAKHILHGSTRLIDLPSDIARGSSSGADDVFILKRVGKMFVTRQGKQVDIEEGILRCPIFATDFGRYSFTPEEKEAIIFPYDVSSSGYHLKSIADLQKHFPKTYEYLFERKKELEERKQFKTWYGFSASRSLNVHENAHMLVPLLADRGLFCRLVDRADRFCLMASGGFSITINAKNELSPNYVLGLLNSNLLFWKLRSISNVFRGGWITCTKQYVETLPIHDIDFSIPAERSRHDRMVNNVDSMIILKKRLSVTESSAQKEILHRQIEATDREIDQLVYELYSLTKEEIKIIEGETE